VLPTLTVAFALLERDEQIDVTDGGAAEEVAALELDAHFRAGLGAVPELRQHREGQSPTLALVGRRAGRERVRDQVLGIEVVLGRCAGRRRREEKPGERRERGGANPASFH
jgi:hypothetical protein